MASINYDIKDDNSYLFECAELEVKELEFLDKGKMDRIIKSKNLKELIKNLGDTVYIAYSSELENSGSFEKVITDEYSKIAGYLSRRLKPSHMAMGEILFFEEILHNLKIIFKSIILDENLEGLFVPLFYSYSSLRKAIREEKYNGLSESVSATLQFILEVAGRKGEKDYRILEFEMEKIYMREMFKSAEKLGSDLIKSYVKHLIDILNIKNIYRNRYLEEEPDQGYFLYENGYLPAGLMAELKNKGFDIFQKEMKRTDYADIVARGTGALDSEEMFYPFEREENLFYINILEPLKYTVSNIEKILRFFFRKKMELKSLLVIFTGVIYGIDVKKIEERAGA